MRVVFRVNASAAPHAALVSMTGQIVEFGAGEPQPRTARPDLTLGDAHQHLVQLCPHAGFGARLGKWAREQFRYRAPGRLDHGSLR